MKALKWYLGPRVSPHLSLELEFSKIENNVKCFSLSHKKRTGEEILNWTFLFSEVVMLIFFQFYDISDSLTSNLTRLEYHRNLLKLKNVNNFIRTRKHYNFKFPNLMFSCKGSTQRQQWVDTKVCMHKYQLKWRNFIRTKFFSEILLTNFQASIDLLFQLL